MRLEGKVALISGGARGQGAVEARLFAKEGAQVVIGDILDDEGAQVVKEIEDSGGGALYVHLDVTSTADWRKAVDDAVARFGKLNVVVNNAGIWRAGKVEDTTDEEWDAVMEVNVKGVFLGTRESIPAMRNSGGGSIVNISSTAGLVGSDRATAYVASKGAVRLLTKATAVQYAKEGIRANSIHPGTDRYGNASRHLASDRPRQADFRRQKPYGKARHLGGRGQLRPVSGLRRVVIHDRLRAGRRRRLHRPVAAGLVHDQVGPPTVS